MRRVLLRGGNDQESIMRNTLAQFSLLCPILCLTVLGGCDLLSPAPQHTVTGIAGGPPTGPTPTAAPRGNAPAAPSGAEAAQEPGGPPTATPSATLEPIGLPVDQLIIDGETVSVHWPDGDSLDIEDGRYRGQSARIAGYNTLEGYGAVQRWGDWSYTDLAEASSPSTDLARSQAWTCTNTGEEGAYNRILLECEPLMMEMLRRGLAHLFTIHDPISAAAIAAQQDAQRARRGIWAQGVPEAILTSVTSTADGNRTTFNRYVDTRNGQAERDFHDEQYAPCEDVCRSGSCMRYLPHDRRFGRNRLRCSDSH